VTKTVLFDAREDGVRVLTMHRPSQRNAFDSTMLRELADCVARVNEDSAAKALVLRGSSESFSAGRDRSELADIARHEAGQAVPSPGGHESSMFRSCQVPTVAVAEGPVVGGGLGFFLQCDVRVATPHARLLDGHLLNGMVSSVPSFYLPRLGSIHHALEVLCTRDGISAERAYEIGYVDVLAEPDQLNPTVEGLLGGLTQWDGELLRQSVSVLRHAVGHDYESTMALVGHLRALRRRSSQREALE
jgi:enoyl-CoA hydratase/carnithine racemase